MRLGVREFMFFIVLLAVPIASFVYVFKPRNEDIRSAKQEIEVKQAKLEQLATLTRQLEDIGYAIEKGRESIEVIEAKLPSQRDVEGILEQVWQIASRNGLAQRSLKSQKPVPAANYMELPLRVVMDGEFNSFYQFLLELEGLERITRIHQMTLKRASEMSGRGRDKLPPGWIRAEFTLSIFFEP